MKLCLVALLCVPMWAQENTLRLTVLGYQWTTTHNSLTFSWPGYANTSCNGNINMNGNVSGGDFYASGTSSNTCSTTYTPPSNQTIDIRKPVVFILADTESSRMVLTCTRNVRWSQCHALNPGSFLARNDNGHFEVQALSGKGKDEWVKFDIVQQSAISRQQLRNGSEVQASGDPCSRLPEGANGCKNGKSVSQLHPPPPQEAPASVEKLVEIFNSKFRADNAVGYAESSGDTFTIHSERSSNMRFHMMLADKQLLDNFRTAGIKHLVYTNDSDQRFTYDLADSSGTAGQKEKQDQAWGACARAKWLVWRSQQPSVLPEGTRDPVLQFYEQCKAGQ